MKLARVLGTVVATEKDAKLGGLRFLMLGLWGHDNKPVDAVVMAIVDSWEIEGDEKYRKGVTDA